MTSDELRVVLDSAQAVNTEVTIETLNSWESHPSYSVSRSSLHRDSKPAPRRSRLRSRRELRPSSEEHVEEDAPDRPDEANGRHLLAVSSA